MDDRSRQAEQFEQHRGHLLAVAYRMLGSYSDAEDAVQEGWLRLQRAPDAGIDNMRGWLTTVVGRVCIDMLRVRRAHRLHYVGTWLPEPVVTPDAQDMPEHEAELADSVGLALLVVLESLTPAERLAFVLHDMFGVPFDDIAPMVDRTPVATRQLASRARRRVRGSAPVPDPDQARQRAVVSAFLAAARAGDFEALLEVLDPDVVFRVDAGARARRGPGLLTGAADVARQAVAQGPRFAALCHPATVNGGAGIVARTRTGVLAVAGMTVVEGRIKEIDLILDPAKLGSIAVDD